MTARCSSRGAAIIWARTAKDKAMPLDAQPVLDGNIEVRGGRVHFVTPDANAIENRHKCHFASCPAAKKRRKPKAKT